MRLRWILGLIVLTLALALAACGGGGDEEEENGGDEGESPAATKTVEAEDTETPEVVETKTPEANEPSGGGGGATLSDIPVYPGAEKTGDYSSSDAPLPLFGGDVDVEDWEDSEWAVYETGDSWETVADFYRDKMPDSGWEEEGWSDFSFEGGVAWGSYTRDGGDSAAWVFVSGTDDQTEIVIGAAHK